jgi:uncharacterized protein YbcC (UPF0753/DUF2309 family)
MNMYEQTLKKSLNIHQKVITFKSTKQDQKFNLDKLIKESWKNISPFWPLKNLIAVNPLQGLEDLPIEGAMAQGAAFFQQKELPKPMESVNRETIKWLQAFFDEGQATIEMPLRNHGFYIAWKKLAYFDVKLHGGDFEKKKWLLELPEFSEAAIVDCLLKLKIRKEEQSIFLTLMLITLPGWAAHIKYRTDWTAGDLQHPHSVTQMDYLAIRLIITTLLWEDAITLIDWYKKAKDLEIKKTSPMKDIKKSEMEYQVSLLNKLASQTMNPSQVPDAQFVFCIDVRSEPFRRALESTGNYETFGFAGFFGVPVCINNTATEESYASCPVLLKPKYTVKESPSCSMQSCIQDHKGYRKLNALRSLYQSLKYNFTTAFALVELIGLATGFWMAMRALMPRHAIKTQSYIVQKIRPNIPFAPSLENIPFTEQSMYAESALRAMGLTKNFAAIVVFCGHGSATQNNAFATALDCGACGGRHGASNARILANILNDQKIRQHLKKQGILIPPLTYFIAAEHNTTADEVEMYLTEPYHFGLAKKMDTLKVDLKKAGKINSEQRAKKMGFEGNINDSAKHTKIRSIDWAQVRPEWGLARNASFIVAPRELSKNIDLEGRAFLHSYDYRQDPDGASLTVILTAPMVVAQWINSQYLFSTLDNVAYGAGSKTTKNITGKIGVMQGNASDLMHGLPLQSVNISDTEAYHNALRLTTVVYAPCGFIDKIIQKQPVLQKLFGNGWVTLSSIDPENTNNYYFLNRDLTWGREIP